MLLTGAAGPGLIHCERSPTVVGAIEGLNCGAAGVIVHFDESKATATAGLTVCDDGGGTNGTMGTKEFFQLRTVR